MLYNGSRKEADYMPAKSTVKRLSAFVLALSLTLSAFAAFALEDALKLDYLVQETGDSYVTLPHLTGHTEPAVEEAINSAIYEDGGFPGFERILASLDPLGTGLQVRAQAQIIRGKEGMGLLSLLITASGRIGPGKPGYRAVPLVYSLSSGARITAQEVFADVDDAQAALDSLVAQEIEPVISDYLYPEGLYPVPIDEFLIDESGLTFYYEQDAYTTLSGQSGAVSFHWNELEGLLNREEGSLLSSLILSDTADRPVDMIKEAVAEGRLPGLPALLGKDLQEVLQEYPPLTDSEAFPSGEQVHPEDARLRGTALIIQNGELTGMLSRRTNLWGIITGTSSQNDVHAIMGPPDAALPLDESAAGAYGIEPGSLESYRYGGYELRLHYDTDLILKTVWLSRSN